MSSGSANVFGSFLSTIQSASAGTAKQAFDKAMEISSFATSRAPEARDVITTIVRAIEGLAEPATVISIARAGDLTIDQTAAGLRDGTATGLLAPEGDDPVAYRLTNLGRELL